MKHEHKLARKVLWAIAFISLIALIAVFLEVTTFSFAVELLILGIGLLVTGACLLFLIKEHHAEKAKERALIQQLVVLIEQQALSSVAPEVLTKALEAHLAPLEKDQRLKVLNHYLKNPSDYTNKVDK